MLHSSTVRELVQDEVDSTHPQHVLALELDTAQARADIDLLTKAANRSLQLAQRLLDLGDLAAHLSVLNIDADPAAPTDQLRCCLQLSDALRELVTAVRAGQFDGLVV